MPCSSAWMVVPKGRITIEGYIGGRSYTNSISDTKNRVKQGYFIDGISWLISDDFGRKRRNDFSQTLAKAKKKTYEFIVSLCFSLVELVGIEPTTS